MNMKKKVLFLAVFLLISYGIFSLRLSYQVNRILDSSYQNYGRNNPYQDIVSDSIYCRMCYRHMGCRFELVNLKDGQTVKEENARTFPITYFWGGKVKTFFSYKYKAYVDGELVRSNSNTFTFTLQFVNGKWIISDMFDPP